MAHVGDDGTENLVILHVFAFQSKIHFFVIYGSVAKHLANPVLDRVTIIGHQQDRVVFLDGPCVFFFAVDDDLEDAVFLHWHIEAAVLIAATGTHARY